MRLATRLRQTLICLMVLGLLFPYPSEAYSVLTHEAIIDSAWEKNIRPLLLDRFPNVASDDLRKAHGYAYGGAIIQDMGYYPHGSKFLRDSQDLDDYAFALGAMAHYAADNSGR